MLTPSRSAIARWVLAAVLLWFGLGRLWGESSINAFMDFAVFIGALSLIVWEAAPWLAKRFSLPFIEVYFPSLSFPKPPLSYTLAHHYRDQGRLEDAAEQYEKIIRYHPGEEAAYLELIEVAEKMEDRKLAGRYADLHQRRFRPEALVLSE